MTISFVERVSLYAYISESQIHQSIIYLILIKGSSVLVGQGIRKVGWNHLNLSSKQLTILVFFGQELWVFSSFCCLKSMQPVPMPVISHLEPSWTCGLWTSHCCRPIGVKVCQWFADHTEVLCAVHGLRKKYEMKPFFFWGGRVFGEGILFRLEGSWKFLSWRTPASLFHEVLPRDFFFRKRILQATGPAEDAGLSGIRHASVRSQPGVAVNLQRLEMLMRLRYKLHSFETISGYGTWALKNTGDSTEKRFAIEEKDLPFSSVSLRSIRTWPPVQHVLFSSYLAFRYRFVITTDPSVPDQQAGTGSLVCGSMILPSFECRILY